MATLSQMNLTLIDAIKRRNADGSQAKIVEMLNQTNEILMDMLWRPTNQTASHRTTLRTSLPTAYFKLLNQGTFTSKSTTAQVEEACAKIEAWSEIDSDLVDQEQDKGAFLLSESQPFFESLNEKMARYLFYGNRNTEPEAFTGLGPRYSALSGTNQSQNVLNGLGSGGVNTSVWFTVWGDNTLHGIFPQKTTGGLQHVDHGKKVIETGGNLTEGRRLEVYQSQFQWHCGLALRDWRGACRIANIDTDNVSVAASAANLTELMVKAWHRIRPVMKMGKPAIYMNSTVAQALDLQRMRILNGAGTSVGGSNLGGAISADMVDGEMRYSFRGIPIRIVDQLLNTEAAVA